MTNWAELSNDMIAHIATRVKVIEDFIAFRAVCTSWRTAATKDNFDVLSPQLPLLMLAEKEDGFREFYSLSKKQVSRLCIPEARWRICFPSEGWLICFLPFTLEISLLNPFSRNQIQLPPGKNLWPACYEAGPGGTIWHYIDKAILSVNPSVTSDYVLMVSYYVPVGDDCLGGDHCLAFWRPGDLNYTKIDISEWGSVTAMNYYKGKFYFVTLLGHVCFFDIGLRIPQPIVKPQLLISLKDFMFHEHSSLVKLSGALFFVTRYYHGGRCWCQTFKFKVYELDVTNGELKVINSLGDSTIFLGLNGASSIDSSKCRGVQPNHIYFIKDWYERCEECGDGRNTGAYNFENGKIESFYPELSPRNCFSLPTWITPSIL